MRINRFQRFFFYVLSTTLCFNSSTIAAENKVQASVVPGWLQKLPLQLETFMEREKELRMRINRNVDGNALCTGFSESKSRLVDALFDIDKRNEELYEWLVGLNKEGKLCFYHRLFWEISKIGSSWRQWRYENDWWIGTFKDFAVILSAAAIAFHHFGGTEWLKEEIRKMFNRPSVYRFRDRRAGMFKPVDQDEMVREDDVVLAADIRRQVKELIYLINRRKDIKQLGARRKLTFPFVLLYGPPGTGKTTIAHMIADNTFGDNGRPMNFISLAATDFNKIKNVGDRIIVLDEMFARANALGNTIIFLDEIEGMVRERSDRNDHDPFLIKLLKLTEQPSSRVMVVTATNHIEKVDAALLNRIDRKLHIEMPNIHAIRLILDKQIERHLICYGYTSALDTVQVAPLLSGLSGRDIRNLIRNAQYRLDFYDTNELDNAIFREILIEYGVVSPENTAANIVLSVPAILNEDSMEHVPSDNQE